MWFIQHLHPQVTCQILRWQRSDVFGPGAPWFQPWLPGGSQGDAQLAKLVSSSIYSKYIYSKYISIEKIYLVAFISNIN